MRKVKFPIKIYISHLYEMETNHEFFSLWALKNMSLLIATCTVSSLSAEPLTICCDDPYWVRESLRENDSASKSGTRYKESRSWNPILQSGQGFEKLSALGKRDHFSPPLKRMVITSLRPILWKKFWEIKTHSSYARTKIFLKRALVRTWRNRNSRPLRAGM